MEHKISLICPVKNEENFLPIHFENWINKVDEIIYCDTGSGDRTPELLKKFKDSQPDKIKLLEYKVANPYNWEEGIIRQTMVDASRNDLILLADSDEVASDDFSDIISKYELTGKFAGFTFLTFWKNLNTIRCSVENDAHWFPIIKHSLFNRKNYYYENTGNHSFLKCHGKTEWVNIPEIKLYHLHYAMFNRVKPNDNRLCDLGLLEYWGAGRLPEIIEDYRFDALQHKEYELKTIKYTGDYPKCLHNYITKR